MSRFQTFEYSMNGVENSAKKSSTMSLDEFKDMREEWRKSIAEAEIKRTIFNFQINLHRTYTQIKKNQYIVRTLIDKKLKYS